MEEKLRSMFGNSWFNLLKDYLLGQEFLSISRKVNNERKTKKVIPEDKDLLFKAFRLCPTETTYVVILGQDPYHDILSNGRSRYDGLAFSNGNNELRDDISPSLFKVMNILIENFGDRSYDEMIDLSSWPRKGVLLVNTALSVIQGLPESHLSLWRPFTEHWIKRLSETIPNIVWLLWGSKAQSYELFIQDKDNHFVIKCGHPSPLNMSVPFDRDCFVKANMYMKVHHGIEVKW